MPASQKLVNEFISITGSDETTANHLLEAFSNNLELAVSNYLDENASKNNSENGSAASKNNKDKVRAPIPQTRGIFSNTRQLRSVKQMSAVQRLCSTDKNVKRLEDLFRPPLDMMHRGSFESAREEGTKSKKWLLVNIQNTKEFACQVLNRDVWSSSSVKTIIKENFVFWQVYSDSSEGERFMTFYSINGWPHVSILDPRTGGRMGVLTNITKDSVIQEVRAFLDGHGTLDPEEPPTKRTKRDILDASEDSQLAAAIAASLRENTAKKVVDSESEFEISSESEDEKKNSEEKDGNKEQEDQKIKEDVKTEQKPRKPLVKIFPKKKKPNVENSNSEKTSEMFSAPSKQVEPTSLNCNGNSRSTNPVSNGASKCKLVLRFPNGKRDIITMYASDTLKDLAHFISSKDFDLKFYEFLTNFPRKKLSSMDDSITLDAAGLCPQDTIFIQEKL
uniref:UBX domain-containing protein n=1 Tax=Ciona intestinalis TaxID=7719 RepID=F7BMH5_CIOIN